MWRAEAIWRALLLESLSNRRNHPGFGTRESAEPADLLVETMSATGRLERSSEVPEFCVLGWSE
jgi:hypothetical protein